MLIWLILESRKETLNLQQSCSTKIISGMLWGRQKKSRNMAMLLSPVKMMKKAMLFDETRKLLETRFLKKDEVIKSGEMFALSAHLVDAGEPEGQEGRAEFKFQSKGCYVQKTGKLHGEDDCIIVDDFEDKEWEALFTTQITQKSKKYHVGILRLASSGSFCNKVTLLGEDKTILSNKYISLSEDIKTGSTLEQGN